MKAEIQVYYNNRIYKQPKCRLKIDDKGGISTLIVNDQGKWEAVKGQVYKFKILNTRKKNNEL